jgi:hypothetical protein
MADTGEKQASQATSGLAYPKYRSDEEKAKIYGNRIYQSDQQMDDWHGLADDWYHRYENAPRRSQVTPKGHRVNVSTGVATIDTLYSSMTAVDVDVILKNGGGATRMQAELATAALSKEWELLNVQGSTNDACKDALIVGIGFAKVAYEYVSQEEKQPRSREAVSADITTLLKQANDARDAGVPGEMPTPDDIANMVELEELVEKVLRDRIVVDYVPWADMRWSPGAKRWEDVTWWAQKSRVSVKEVRANPTFRAYVKRTKGGLKRLDELKGTSAMVGDLLPGGKPTDDDMFYDIIEYWDLLSGTACTLIEGQKWFLNEDVNPFALNIDIKDRSPFVPLVLRKTNTRVRGISDMELMAPSLDEQAVYRTNTANYIEHFVPKVTGPEDALTDEGKVALGSPEYGAYVATAREYPNDVIKELNPPVLPSEAWQMEARVEEDIRNATGVNELMRGMFPDRKQTATETSEVVAGSAARQSEKRNTFEDFYLGIARRILQLMQMYYDQPRVVRYVDPSYGEVPWEFTGDDIAMGYDMSVHLTPKEAYTRQTKRDDALALFNMLVPLAQQPGPDGATVVDAAKLVEWFANEYGMDKESQLDILNLPEEKEAQQMAAQEQQAGMAQAAQGVPPGIGGTMAAATDTGAVDPAQLAAAASGGLAVGAPGAVEQVSESAGVAGLGV